jgi:hypothetical protein
LKEREFTSLGLGVSRKGQWQKAGDFLAKSPNRLRRKGFGFMRLLKRIFGGRQKPALDYTEPVADPSEPELDPYEPFPEPVEIEISDVFDLHAFAPRDIKRVVEEYLTQARAAGFSRVRLIHGKGVGVQRETVRSILARTAFVIDFKDAPPEAGGWGATVARLKVER